MFNASAEPNSVQTTDNTDTTKVQSAADVQLPASPPKTSDDPAPAAATSSAAPTPVPADVPVLAPSTKVLYTHSFNDAEPGQVDPTLNFTTNNTWNVNLNYRCSAVPPQPLVFGVYSNLSDYNGSVSLNVTADNLTGTLNKQFTETGSFTIHAPDYCAWDLVITENL